MSSHPARRFAVLALTLLLTSFSIPALAASAAEAPLAELDEQLFTPDPDAKGTCISCVGSYSTAVNWGMGATCAAAFQDLENHVLPEAHDFCRTTIGGLTRACDFELVGTCYYSGGQYVVDGYGAFGCWEGDYFCPEW